MKSINLWYTHSPNPPARKQENKEAVCSRCRSAVSPATQKTATAYQMEHEVHLCDKCYQRKFYLLSRVRTCIRSFGGIISLYDVLDLYDNEESYRHLYFDPYKEARRLYHGEDRLVLSDLLSWIDEGFLERAQGNALTYPALITRESLNTASIKSERKEIISDTHSDHKHSGRGRAFAPRRRKDGGASMGIHQWIASKKRLYHKAS
ncbi:MAG: hypothetical protein ACOX5R_17535 [bacterium]|jgi:hypothetical protein